MTSEQMWNVKMVQDLNEALALVAVEREKNTALRDLIEYHMRREPVLDKEIYIFRNVQGFAKSYKKLIWEQAKSRARVPREGQG